MFRKRSLLLTTLLFKQCIEATRRAKAAGVSHLVTYRVEDYRIFAASVPPRSFDRIVSCEMIEAVGHEVRRPHIFCRCAQRVA